ncbi:acetate kinase [Actinocorallia libanotica]|uniref:Acetate kinase n=1 Tax=Actinocorallia libanotica TaxID=46162 RepID=A0ABP4C592_9ACTN
MRYVLVLNCGSSSIKYRLVEAGSGDAAAGGIVERVTDHGAGMRQVIDELEAAGPELRQVVAVGHRVVHGGDAYAEPVVIDDAVERTIEELSPMAPLHNPVNLIGIRAARAAFPDVPHVAVFDTAFHQTMPPEAYTYAIPREWTEGGVRRYGFHGTSHAYVSRRAAQFLGRPYTELNTIVLHLGNGASASAVEGGRCVDTSMGLTPLEGLVMGTRSGDVDPALAAFLSRTRGLSVADIDHALNHESGLRALAGHNDLREIWPLVDAGDTAAALAMQVYTRRIRKYIGAYHAVLGRLDALVFTAGVGENDPRTRAMALSGLEPLGIRPDPSANTAPSHEARVISTPDSPVTVLVIPTDEEREIATQTLAVTGLT